MKKRFYLISTIILGMATLFWVNFGYAVYNPNCFDCEGSSSLLKTTFKNIRMLAYIVFLLTILILTPFSIVIALRGKKKISFLNNGKKETIIGKIISCDKTKVVFEDKEFRYEAKPSEIIKIKKLNRSQTVLFLFLVLLFIFYVVDVLKITPYLQSELGNRFF